MKPPIAFGAVYDSIQGLFQGICDTVESLPDRIVMPAFLGSIRLPAELATTNTIPNCHAITRALAHYFPVHVVSGNVLEWRNERTLAHQHSWLVPHENEEFIIDVWPLGCVSGPALMRVGHGPEYANGFCTLGGEYLDERFNEMVRATRVAILRTRRTKKRQTA